MSTPPGKSDRSTDELPHTSSELSHERSADKEAERLEQEVEQIRGHLGGLVSELNHRRHEAMDLGLQARRYAIPLALGAVALLGLVAGGVALSIHRSRRRRRLPARLARLRQALARMVDRPERVARPQPSVGLKILAAAGAAAASVVGRRLAQGLTTSDKPSKSQPLAKTELNRPH